MAHTGSWRRQVVRRSPGDLDGQIAELLAPLTGDMATWLRLTNEFRADVFCGLFMDSNNEGIEISNRTLVALGARNLSLDLDIYSATETAANIAPARLI